MDNYWNDKEEDEEKQVTKLNVRSVMNAFAMLNYDTTEREISQQIISFTGHPAKSVRHEVKRILDNGVSNGFIIQVKNKYLLPGEYQTDSDRAAERYFDNCIAHLEESYPDFDYERYLENRVPGSPHRPAEGDCTDEEDEPGSPLRPAESDCTDEESEADVTITVGMSKDLARTIAGESSKVDPEVYCVSSGSEAEDDSEDADATLVADQDDSEDDADPDVGPSPTRKRKSPHKNPGEPRTKKRC